MSRSQSPIFRYGVSTIAVVAAFAVRYSVDPHLDESQPYMFFAPAVMFSAWYGGFWPAIAAMFAGIFLGNYFFVSPGGLSFNLNRSVEATQLAMFFLVTIPSILIVELLHRARRQTEAILSSIANANVMLAPCGRIRETNAEAAGIFSCKPDDLKGRILSEVIAPEAEAALADLIQRTTTDHMPHHEDIRLAEDRWYAFYTFPFYNEVAVYFADISERKNLESRLHDSMRQLIEADRQRDRFLDTLAHELRGPLAPIKNASQLLNLFGQDIQSVKKATGIIQRQVDQLASLVDDLLDISRIKHGKIRLQQQHLDLAAVISNIIPGFQSRAAAHGLELVWHKPAEILPVNADPTRIEQIFNNLIENAVKYTPAKGTIEIKAAQEDGKAVVHIKDTGIGIEPRLLPDIFDVFMQVDQSLDRSQGGLGLGLPLVKELVRLHGGKIEAHSEGLNKGSDFIICLPLLDPADFRPALPACPVEAAACNKRVLIVEDNPDALESMAVLLAAMNCTVETAHNGPDGLEKAIGWHPEIAFIDIGLPGLDGCEVARRIRRTGCTEMLLVALSGYGQATDRERAKTAGFDRYLIKPAALHDLQKVISESGLTISHCP